MRVADSGPAWVESDYYGGDEPELHCRIELRDDVPRLIELCWRAAENQKEIRQKYLRAVELERFVNTIYRQWIVEVREVSRTTGVGIPTLGDEQHPIIRNLVSDLRSGRRHVNAELLRQVADVYRANFDNAPAEAVARTFGVKRHGPRIRSAGA